MWTKHLRFQRKKGFIYTMYSIGTFKKKCSFVWRISMLWWMHLNETHWFILNCHNQIWIRRHCGWCACVCVCKSEQCTRVNILCIIMCRPRNLLGNSEWPHKSLESVNAHSRRSIIRTHTPNKFFESHHFGEERQTFKYMNVCCAASLAWCEAVNEIFICLYRITVGLVCARLLLMTSCSETRAHMSCSFSLSSQKSC